MSEIMVDLQSASTVLFTLGYKSSDYASLAAAVSAIGSNPATLYINRSEAVTSDLIIPATLSIVMVKPGLITVSSGRTLTINGPFEAGLFQVFAGSGTVTFGKMSIAGVYPEWWGAVLYTVDSAACDSSAAFQKAVNSGKTVYVSEGDWLCNFTIAKSDVVIRGNGGRSTRLFPYADTDCIKLDSTSAHNQHVKISDLALHNLTEGVHTQRANSNGITITGPDIYHFNDYQSFHDLHIDGFKNGINITGRHVWCDYRNIQINNSLNVGFYCVTDQAVNGLTLSNVTVINSQKHGWYIENTSGDTFTNWTFIFCDAETNGKDTTNPKNSGFYLKNVSSFTFINPHAEMNGTGSTDHLNYAMRFAGTHALNITIRGGSLTGSAGCIISEATISSGVIDNNDIRWLDNTCFGISLTGNYNEGFNGRWNITNRNMFDCPSGGEIYNCSSDANGNYKHFANNNEPLSWWTNTTSPATLDLYHHASVKFNVASPITINTLKNALPGKRVLLTVKGGANVTLGSAIMSSGSDVVLSVGNVLECVVDSYPDEGKLLVISLKV